MGKTCSAEKGHSPTRGTPSKPTFPTFPYEQNDKTLARLERLAASPFFDGRVRPPSRANYISRKVVGKSTRDNPERYQGSFESTLLQRNLKQWYQRYPANSRRIFGRRFSPSEGEEGEKRRPEIRFSQAIRGEVYYKRTFEVLRTPGTAHRTQASKGSVLNTLTGSERVGWGTFRLLKTGERTLKPPD